MVTGPDGTTVLFGGNGYNTSYLGDTWVWNGTATSYPVPAAPAAVSAVAGNGQVTVSWTASSPNIVPSPTAEVTGYTVTASTGQTCDTTGATTCTVTGLTNGTPVTFTVTATGINGPGPASAPSTAVTPAAPPVGD